MAIFMGFSIMETKRETNTFLLGFLIFLMIQTQLFLFFFVAFEKYEQQEHKNKSETILETKYSFYGFSVYKMEKQMQEIRMIFF